MELKEVHNTPLTVNTGLPEQYSTVFRDTIRDVWNDSVSLKKKKPIKLKCWNVKGELNKRKDVNYEVFFDPNLKLFNEQWRP